MYLISLYFDEKTEYMMQSLINKVADKTGNTFMIDGKIPPHITVAAFETRNEVKAIELFEKSMVNVKGDEIFFASVGSFKGKVIYAEPVLNEYLHNLSVYFNQVFREIEDIRFGSFYNPFGWIPHLSIGKHLSKEQMEVAFRIMLEQFSPYKGQVVRIGLAKTNPHRDLKVCSITK
jgi:hypothetical protein